jgi:geranylgeranyl reductase family protein
MNEAEQQAGRSLSVTLPEGDAMHQVVIVGAGPAGSTAALCLARAGLNCLLLDKARFPRDKLCGGFLSSRTLGLLEELHGPHLDKSLYHIQDDEYEIFHQGEAIHRARLGMPMAFVQRIEFDAFLLDAAKRAGVAVLENCRATSFEQDERQIRIMTADGRVFEADWALAADGALSQLRRQVQPGYKPGGKALEVQVPTQDPGIPRIDFGGIQRGYGWSFPKRGCATIGVFGQQGYFEDPRGSLDDYMNLLGLPVRDTQIKGWPLPDLPLRPLDHGRLLFLGDAGGLCDPVSGEGLYYALRSGQQAACSLAIAQAEMPRHAPLIAGREYNGRVGFILRQLQASRIFRPIFHSSGRQRILLESLLDLPEIGKVEWQDILRVTAIRGLDLLRGSSGRR